LSNNLLNLNLDLKSVKNIKLPGWLRFRTPAASPVSGGRVNWPHVAFEVGGPEIVLARLTKDADRKWGLTSFDVAPMPEGVTEGDAFRLTLKAPDRLKSIVAAMLQKEGVKTRTVSLVIPDHLARVSIIPLESLPRSRRDLAEMLRWKMKKSVPFKVEDAALDYEVMPLNGGNGGFQVLVALIPRHIVAEHEEVFISQGIRPGLVELSSFALVNLYRNVIDHEVPAGGDFMVVNITGSFFTVMIFRAGRILFYRCKAFTADDDGSMEGRRRLLRREVQASLVYYQERLAGTDLARLYVRTTGLAAPEALSALSVDSMPVAAEPLDVRRALPMSGRIDATGDRADELLQKLAPAVGAAVGRAA